MNHATNGKTNESVTGPNNAGRIGSRTESVPAPLLTVSGLHVQFPTRRGLVRAVNGVSFDVKPGEVVGIVGESGSGKSMTARSILRIVPPPGRVTSGQITLDGTDLLTLSEREMGKVRGRRIAMIFQEPSASLNPVLSIGEQIVEALNTHRKLKGREARDRAIEHLREVGIPAPEQRINAYPHQLSGGMRQRAMIAIALSCAPQLLIADEPTTALDVTIQAQILDLLVRLSAQRQMGLIFITHNVAAIAQIAERILVMYAGEIVESGLTAQIIDHPQHPYTKALLQAMPTMSTTRGERLLEIPGSVPDLASVPPGCPFHPRCAQAFERCMRDIPVLAQTEPDRSVACWLYDSTESETHADYRRQTLSR